MALTWKQRKVLTFINESEDNQITLKQAMGIIDTHYCNGEKHVGNTLSRMVKSGLLERVKPGVFIAGKGMKEIKSSSNQTNLF